MNVCVVGNSPLLLENEHGAAIDSYDVVIRCNRFLIKGYEKHVGTRIDYTIVNESVMNQRYGEKRSRHRFAQWKNKDTWPKEGIIVLIHETQPIRAGLYQLEIISYSKQQNAFARKWGVRRPKSPTEETFTLSCGSAAILFAKEYLKAEAVSCYGFTRNYKGKCTHYFEKVNKKTSDHDHKRELQLMIDLYGVKFYE